MVFELVVSLWRVFIRGHMLYLKLFGCHTLVFVQLFLSKWGKLVRGDL